MGGKAGAGLIAEAEAGSEGDLGPEADPEAEMAAGAGVAVGLLLSTIAINFDGERESDHRVR